MVTLVSRGELVFVPNVRTQKSAVSPGSIYCGWGISTASVHKEVGMLMISLTKYGHDGHIRSIT